MNIGPGTVISRDFTEIFGLLQMTPMAITIARLKKLDDVLHFAVWTTEANASGVEIQINVLVTLSSMMGHGRRVETITLCDLYLTKVHFIFASRRTLIAISPGPTICSRKVLQRI